MCRADRWLSKFNDPLVNRLSEHEITIQELVTDQELRVKSANEVLATMKLIAGMTSSRAATPPLPKPLGAESSPAGREAFLSVREKLQGGLFFQCLLLLYLL